MKKINNKIVQIIIFMAFSLNVWSAGQDPKSLRVKFKECFSNKENAVSFNKIMGGIRFLKPILEAPDFIKIEEALTEESLKEYFDGRINRLLKGPFSILESYKKINIKDQDGKICRAKIQEEIALMSISLINYHIGKGILVGEKNGKERIIESGNKNGAVIVDTNAISNGVVETLNTEALTGVFDIYNAVYELGNEMFPKRMTNSKQAKRYSYLFEEGLNDSLVNLKEQINFVYGSNFSSRSIPLDKDKDYLLDVVAPLRNQILTILLKNEKTAPTLGLYLIGEFLRPISERLIYISKFRDLFYSFDETLKGDSIYETINLFSKLDNITKISKIMKGSSKIDHQIAQSFQILVENSEQFKSFTTYANQDHLLTYGKDALPSNLETSNVFVKRYLISLYEANQLGKKLIQNKTNPGIKRFNNSQGVKELTFPFSESKYGEILSHTIDNKERLNKYVDQIKNDQVIDYQNIKELVLAKKQSLIIDEEIKRQENILNKKQKEIYVMQKVIAEENRKMDNYVKKLDSLNVMIDGRGISRITELKDSFNLSPNSSDLSHTFAAQKGDLIQFHVTGNWNPACALSKEGFNEEDLRGAHVGPLGIELSFTQSSYNLNSVNDVLNSSHFHEKSSSYSSCVEIYNETQTTVGFGSTTGLIANATNTTGMRASYKNCRQTVTGNRSSEDHSEANSENKRISRDASLVRGLRSLHTPFPAWPVGSLLVIELPQGSSDFSQARNISVLDRDQVILATEDSQFFIVANDCAGGNGTDESLTIEFEVKRSGSALSNKISDYLVKAISKIKISSDTMINEGLINGFDLAKLRAEVQMDIIGMSGHDLNELSIYNDFFNGWIESELSQIEKRSRLTNLNLERDMTTLKLESLFLERMTNRDLERLIYKNVLSSSHADGREGLEEEFNNNLSFLTSFTFPALEFFNEEIYQKSILKSDLISKLDIRDNIYQVSKKLTKFIENLYNQVDVNKKIESNGLNLQRIVVTIPKISEKVDDDFLDDFYGYEDHGYHVMDLAKAKDFWDAVDKKEKFKYNLPLNLLYHQGNIPGLEKNCAYPVVKSIVAILLFDTEKYNKKENASVGVSVNSMMKYILKDDYSYVDIVNSRILQFDIPIFAGQIENLRDYFLTFKNYAGENSGQGLSPLADLEFNFSKLFLDRSGLRMKKDIKSIALVYEIEYRKTSSELCVLKGI